MVLFSLTIAVDRAWPSHAADFLWRAGDLLPFDEP
jgi:hypothetical protein